MYSHLCIGTIAALYCGFCSVVELTEASAFATLFSSAERRPEGSTAGGRRC